MMKLSMFLRFVWWQLDAVIQGISLEVVGPHLPAAGRAVGSYLADDSDSHAVRVPVLNLVTVCQCY
eukprot:SAG31_NODE_5017_length_2799_cov_2.853333_3_plen_66_part_00